MEGVGGEGGVLFRPTKYTYISQAARQGVLTHTRVRTGAPQTLNPQPHGGKGGVPSGEKVECFQTHKVVNYATLSDTDQEHA